MLTNILVRAKTEKNVVWKIYKCRLVRAYEAQKDPQYLSLLLNITTGNPDSMGVSWNLNFIGKFNFLIRFEIKMTYLWFLSCFFYCMFNLEPFRSCLVSLRFRVVLTMRNIVRILSILILSLVKFKFQRTSKDFGVPVTLTVEYNI